MKHIKKYRGKLDEEIYNKLQSRARQQAKQILKKKHLEEYKKIFEPIYRKMKREYFKELEGGNKK